MTKWVVAFDSLFGGADVNQAASVAARPPSAQPGGAKDWYVAIEDSQVGPVDVAEIEQRWDARELSEDSLA
ncbi:MAG: GYF domain-containing protein [Myxococcota bacterium]